MAEVFTAALQAGDPRAVGPGWIVADVLLVAAFEFGDPVFVFILVEADDFAGERFHFTSVVAPACEPAFASVFDAADGFSVMQAAEC